MEKLMTRSKAMQYVFIIVGTVLMAVSINLAYEPMEMVTGGVTGLAIVIKDLTGFIMEGGVPIWVTNIVLNIPLIIFAIILLGKHVLINTLFATLCLSAALAIVPTYNILPDDYLLASIFGGTIGGVGMGLVFFASASTGGTDLMAMLIRRFKPYYSLPRILIVIDGIIVIVGALVFGLPKTMYAIIAVYITTKVSDGILEGLKFAKMAYVISDHYEKIASEIMKQLDRGVTGIYAQGMYSKNDKKMLCCVVSKKEIVELTELVSKIDPRAFIIVSDVREVMGEGFIEYKQ